MRTGPVLGIFAMLTAVTAVAQDEGDVLRLDQALQMAFEHHPELAAAGARVEAAEGRALEAGLFPNPEFFARMESARLSGATTGDAEYLTGIAQPIPLSDRLGKARRAEQQERDRMRLRQDALRLDIATDVRRAYAEAVYQSQVLDTWQRTAEYAQAALRVAEARLDAGDAIPSEVAQARIEVQRAQISADRAQREFDQAIDAIRVAMGAPGIAISGVSQDVRAQNVTAPPVEPLLDNIENHPAIAAAEARVLVWEHREALARAERKPDLGLEVAYRRIGSEETNSLDVGVSIPIPLFDRNQGSIQAARAEAVAARHDAATLRNELELRLRDAHRRLAQAIRAAELLRDEVLPQAEQVLETVETRYRAGDISLADVLPVRRDTTQLRLDHLSFLRDVMRAWADLIPFVALDAQADAP